MKSSLLAYTAVLLIMSDCTGNSGHKQLPTDSELIQSKPGDSVRSYQPRINNAHDSVVVDTQDSSFDMYRFQNDTLIQLAYVHYLSRKRIIFRLTTINRAKGQTYNLADTAENTSNDVIPDPATYNDELNGDVLYPVYEFECNKQNQRITIGVEPSRGKRLSVQTHPGTLGGPSTPLHSTGTLRLVRLSTTPQEAPHVPG